MTSLEPLPDRARVLVVVPARDSAATIERCLAAVLAHQPAVDEVVVAVGPSDDDTRAIVEEICQRSRRVRLVDNPSGRTPDALNAAIAASTGEVVVRVDAHAELPPGYVQRAVQVLRDTGAANVGGRQVPVAEHGFGRAVAAAMVSPLGAGGAAYRTGSSAGPVDTVYLGVYRREALDAVGGFDRRFVRNQDAELNERLRRAGYTVWFDPDLSVRYTPRSTIRGLAAQYWQYGRWRRLTGRVHRGSLRLRQLAAPAVVLALGASLVTGLVFGWWWLPPAAGLGYGLVLMGASLKAADRPVRSPGVAVALATMHLSWGAGFLRGPPRPSRHDVR